MFSYLMFSFGWTIAFRGMTIEELDFTFDVLYDLEFL